MRRALLLSCCLLGAGCALLGKNEPLVPRYFTPEYEGAAAGPAAGGAEPAKAPPGLRLRLGRVSAWAHLRERMVVRKSPQELWYDDGRRWTERPEVYLRRALQRTLFEERGLTDALAGAAPTLEVEIAAFEELRTPQRHARLQALIVLHDDRTARLEETITIDEPVIPGPDMDVAVVDALSRALHAGVDRIADRVVQNLAAAPARGP